MSPVGYLPHLTTLKALTVLAESLHVLRDRCMEKEEVGGKDGKQERKCSCGMLYASAVHKIISAWDLDLTKNLNY